MPIDQVERAAQSRQGACLCPLLTHQRQQAGGQEHGANACLGQFDQRQVGIELHGGDKPEGGQGLAQIAVGGVLQIHGQDLAHLALHPLTHVAFSQLLAGHSFLQGALVIRLRRLIQSVPHQIEGLLQQPFGTQPMARRQATGADPEQGIPAAHPGQNDRGVVGREGNVGIPFKVGVHEAGEVARQQGFGAGDGQRGLIREDLAVRQHPLHFGEARGYPGEQFTGLGSEADMTAIRLDELLAKALLQLGDALADRRLTDIEAACNLGHGALACQQAECLQPFQ